MAIGVGAEEKVDLGIVVAAVVGTGIAAALWWLYFDVVALVAARRLAQAEVGREQNEMARDSYSILHLPMVAGIVLVALGHEEDARPRRGSAQARPGDARCSAAPRCTCSPTSAFRYRHIHTFNTRRLGLSILLVAFIPVAVEIPALVTISVLAAALALLIVVETHAYGESRHRTRQELRQRGVAAGATLSRAATETASRLAARIALTRLV